MEWCGVMFKIGPDKSFAASKAWAYVSVAWRWSFTFIVAGGANEVID